MAEHFRARQSANSISTEMSRFPYSSAEMALLVHPTFSASWACVIFRMWRRILTFKLRRS